jgi:hypothetical protein
MSAQSAVCEMIGTMPRPDEDRFILKTIEAAMSANLSDSKIEAMKAYHVAFTKVAHAKLALEAAKKTATDMWDAVRVLMSDQSDLFDPDELERRRRQEEAETKAREDARKRQQFLEGIHSLAGQSIELEMKDGTILRGTAQAVKDTRGLEFKLLPTGKKKAVTVPVADVIRCPQLEPAPAEAANEAPAQASGISTTADEIAAEERGSRDWLEDLDEAISPFLNDADGPEHKAWMRGFERGKAAWKEGGLAYTKNTARDRNPFDKDGTEKALWECWDGGWHDAKCEADEAAGGDN